MTITTNSERETSTVGKRLAARLSPNTVVALFGDLGAGKTAFVRGLAEGLGIAARVSSPTFTIVNEYPNIQAAMPLFHFDMYRLATSDELYDIGWDDYLERGGIIAVEWSENVEDALPPDCVTVRISKTDDSSRCIDINTEV
ncbi:MAG: tRNA (adenosine(37)-N6)-threonylcarbamoyltransferase complex ATPase subunit type 1 TsaE [Oscillospiraceae bacterium]|jgi:tRNA threonylcarbamoyladenosine biosynthesis protein TsaE|nr:tRNA (adenosine(37)-N6)-threonylcarbamoyltransferase complex ATPase subunit type 1 TsaE [Oscillospiraceae bacterium]